MFRIIILGVLALLLLVACNGGVPTQPAVSAQGLPVITVFKSPT